MKTIFIVDDSETCLFMGKTALDGTYKTFTMPSAAHMFKLLEQIIPDLILLDIDMPEMDGFEAISILKKRNTTGGIPVIFLTSRAEETDKSKGFNLGAVDYIVKPYMPSHLIERIENHISGEEGSEM